MRRLSQPAAPIQCEPDLSDDERAAVEGAFRWAWAKLKADEPHLLRTGKEEQLTAAIDRLLNMYDSEGKRLAPGLRLFQDVVRGGKVHSASGQIEKAPDLTFRPVDTLGVMCGSDRALFVECKIIDGATHHSLYCSEGVLRFCRAEYSAQMASSMMVGYVRDKTRPFDVLQAKLSAVVHNMIGLVDVRVDKASSTHSRAHLVPPRVSVSITHLWFHVPL